MGKTLGVTRASSGTSRLTSSKPKGPTKTIDAGKRARKKAVSLQALQMARDLAHIAPRPRRGPPVNYADSPEMVALDAQIGVMPPGPCEDDDDPNHIQFVPGRPAKFRMTFGDVYRHAKWDGQHYVISCCEKGCPDVVLKMDVKWIEIDAPLTARERPSRPPVCHDVPWTALEMQMLENERLAGKRYTALFRQSVCWEPTNLRAGHKACNGAGVKVKASNATTTILAKANQVISVAQAKFNGPIWA